MRKLRISVIDLIYNSSSQSLYKKAMLPNYMSIMPQVVAVWCSGEGHKVMYSLFTGSQTLLDLPEDNTDLVFISSFTFTAQIAYALSNFFRSKGIPTVLGGPHARCYPVDACKYFDYVLGLTNKELLIDLLHNFKLNCNGGEYLSAPSQPDSLPGVRERWEYIEKVQRQSSIVKVVPMIGSLGCPYKCDYCIDSGIDYQSLDMEIIREDLRFLVKTMRHPRVAWYDPNFGVNFNQLMDCIESSVPPGSVEFVAESSLSNLSETNVRRLKRNGFKIIITGVESWYNYGNKSRTGSCYGMDKVNHVAEQVNMIQRYIPQVQTNFIFGFDNDQGKEPFDLTKRFIDLAPGIYPAFAFLSIFGKGSEGNHRYYEEDRIIPFPFHFLRSAMTLNIRPKNYTWEEFYLYFIDLLKYSFSNRTLLRRLNSVPITASTMTVLFLSMNEDGRDRMKNLTSLLKTFNQSQDFISFIRKESGNVPAFMTRIVKNDLGPLWDWLPDKSFSYDLNTDATAVSSK
jgi:hypothetical protein